jgi:hypothetical protein
MCDVCDPYFRPVPIGSDAAFRSQISAVNDAVIAGRLRLVDGSQPWPINASATMPIASYHAFTCRCAQVFVLQRGGCSAAGDQWRALDAR